jgi:hypothetical protein
MDFGRLDGLSERRYRVSTTPYLPQGDLIDFPCFTENPTSSLILTIEPHDGAAWYADVRSNTAGVGRFWATSDPHVFCSLFGDAAYWVDVRDPRSVVGYPAHNLGGNEPLFVKHHDLLLFSDGASIQAYDPSGFRWRTARLAFDEIIEFVVDGDVLRGVADDYPDHKVPFAVDLKTGAHEGGFPGWEGRVRRLD